MYMYLHNSVQRILHSCTLDLVATLMPTQLNPSILIRGFNDYIQNVMSAPHPRHLFSGEKLSKTVRQTKASRENTGFKIMCLSHMKKAVDKAIQHQ